MSWNLFEKIINVIRPCNKSEQTSETPDTSQQQQWPENSSDTSQSWPEGSTEQPDSTEQPEASQEPSPSYQETPSSPQQKDWQQD